MRPCAAHDCPRCSQSERSLLILCDVRPAFNQGVEQECMRGGGPGRVLQHARVHKVHNTRRHVISPAFSRTPAQRLPEARGASNRWSGVVRGTKVVGKSHARACRRRFPAPHPFDLNVPEGGRWGGAGLRRLLLNRRLNPFLGGVLGECGRAQRLESRCHFILKNDPMSLFGFCLPRRRGVKNRDQKKVEIDSSPRSLKI